MKCFILMSMSQINGIVKGTVVPTPLTRTNGVGATHLD